MAPNPSHPDANPAAGIGEQGDAGGGGSNAGNPANQPPRRRHRHAGPQALKLAAANYQLLPPTTFLTRNHRCRQFAATAPLQLQQAAQPAVVGIQLAQAALIAESLAAAHPLTLGTAGPERPTQQGVGIGEARSFAQSHGQQGQHQQGPGPGLDYSA